MARSQSAYVRGAVVACQRDHREQQLEVTVAKWGIQDVEAALKVLPKGPVGEARYSLCDLSRDADASFAVAALDVTLQPSVGLKVLAFNSLDDEDPDGVLCTPSDDVAPGVLPPQLVLTTADAHLLYRTEAAIKAKGGADSSGRSASASRPARRWRSETTASTPATGRSSRPS